MSTPCDSVPPLRSQSVNGLWFMRLSAANPILVLDAPGSDFRLRRFRAITAISAVPLPPPHSSQIIPVWRRVQPFLRVPSCPLWLKVLVFGLPDVPVTRSPD